MKMHKSILSIVAISMVATSLNPISEKQAHIATAVVATLCGAAVFATNGDQDPAKQALLTAGATGLSGLLSAFAFSHYTPFGRYQRAIQVVTRCSTKKILTSAFSNFKDLRHFLKIKYANKGELSDCYLVLGKTYLSSLFKDLTWSKGMFEYARSESSATPQLIELCKAQEQVVGVLLHNCEVALSLVDSDKKEYHYQHKLYDGYYQCLHLRDRLNAQNDYHTGKLMLKFGELVQKQVHHEENKNKWF